MYLKLINNEIIFLIVLYFNYLVTATITLAILGIATVAISSKIQKN